MLIASLGHPVQRTRTAAAYVVAKIAHHDYPEQWPDMLDHLVALLRLDALSAHGSMQVLAEFIHEDAAFDTLPAIASALLPEMLRLYSSQDTDPSATETKCHAITILRDCLESLSMAARETPAWAENINSALSQWITAIGNVLATQSSDSNLLTQSILVNHQ